MKAYCRIGDREHALHGPLATCLRTVADHLGGRTRETLDRLARINRERAPGVHVFDRADLLALVAAAHDLLSDPPAPLRRARRVLEGPLPAADRIGVLLVWLRDTHGDQVVYDLWHSQTSTTS